MLLGKFLRRFKKSQSEKPSWLKWLLGILLMYIVLQGYMMGPKGAPQTPMQKALDDAGTQLSESKVFDFTNYKSRLFPEYGAAVRIKDVSGGKGPAAICGQTARIAYKAFHQNGKPISDSASKDKPLSFVIGGGKAMPVFEQGVIGMSVGGKRDLQAPLAMSYGAKGFERNDILSNDYPDFSVELLSLSPAAPDVTRVPYRVATVKTGYGPPLICGQEAHVHMIVWDLSGKKLYSTVPDSVEDEADTASNAGKPQSADKLPEGLHFTPGRSEVMFGLEQGVIGMNPGSVRTLIIPPSLQKTLDGKAPKIAFPLPDNQTVLVDVEYLP